MDGTVSCLDMVSSFTYSWDSTWWSGCSVTCWGGIQTRTVQCLRNGTLAVADSFCSGTKPNTSQSCNMGSMQYRCPTWYVWTGLSLDCYSLNFAHNANEMCYIPWNSILTCVIWLALIKWVSAVAAPVYGCY